mmetsp:Transcript_30141/g.47251  ORF Transcript_30141/g.47251 Transcript_30141/m.47251 type:complete len:161 (+) Transcript_30141:1315-1797(+)
MKEKLVDKHPSVVTPGIWAFRSGAVISMVHNRGAHTLRIVINDAPPIQFEDIPDNARPFVNLAYGNDTVRLLSTEDADLLRYKWKLKRRGPEDPDYWVWDWERCTAAISLQLRVYAHNNLLIFAGGGRGRMEGFGLTRMGPCTLTNRNQTDGIRTTITPI